MATAVEKVVSHVKENKQIYSDPGNLITLALWGIALASHAVLIPLLIRDFYKDFKQRKHA